ncbi:hypothetical protein ACWKWU_11745 [Chitinophaga lutea]
MYYLRPQPVIGFHGCDESVCQQLLNQPNRVQFSRKPSDWLGSGVYFWENNLERAYHWAQEKESKGTIKKAAVIGAFISLNHCCDLLDYRYTRLLSDYYHLMVEDFLKDGTPIPRNLEASSGFSGDMARRLLDCRVIEYMHQSRSAVSTNSLPGALESHPFDTVRAAFIEGAPVYEGAGFRMKTHIQICVRNLDCILGFFLPRLPVDVRQQEEEHLLREDAMSFSLQ